MASLLKKFYLKGAGKETEQVPSLFINFQLNLLTFQDESSVTFVSLRQAS